MTHIVKIFHKAKPIIAQANAAQRVILKKDWKSGRTTIAAAPTVNLARPFLKGRPSPELLDLPVDIKSHLKFEVRRAHIIAWDYLNRGSSSAALVMLNIARDIRLRNHFWETV